jgi:hypothetical protein
MITIFGEKIGVFLKNQCNDQILESFSFASNKKRQFFRKIVRRKYLKNRNIGPGSIKHVLDIFSPFLASWTESVQSTIQNGPIRNKKN